MLGIGLSSHSSAATVYKSWWAVSASRTSSFFFNLFFSLYLFFLLEIFFIYISNAIPKVPDTLPPALLPNPPTPASWPWHSSVLGHMIFARPMASPPIMFILENQQNILLLISVFFSLKSLKCPFIYKQLHICIYISKNINICNIYWILIFSDNV